MGLEPVLLRLSNKPNELDNEQIELLYVGAALGVIAIFGAALLTSRPPAYDPLAFRTASEPPAAQYMFSVWLIDHALEPRGPLYTLVSSVDTARRFVHTVFFY